MNLNSILPGQAVLIDANIIIYANQQKSRQCILLLERCASGEIFGIIPTQILAEIMHVLMLAEARDVGLITSSNPAKQLSEKPQKLKALHRYEPLMRDLLASGLQLEPIQREDFLTAMTLQHEHGLLTNDALFAAVAVRLRLDAIASADKVFRSLQGIRLFIPDDIVT